MAKLISRMSKNGDVFFYSWRSGEPGPDGKPRTRLRIWHPSLGIYITLNDRRSVASHLHALRAAGQRLQRFEKV